MPPQIQGFCGLLEQNGLLLRSMQIEDNGGLLKAEVVVSDISCCNEWLGKTVGKPLLFTSSSDSITEIYAILKFYDTRFTVGDSAPSASLQFVLAKSTDGEPIDHLQDPDAVLRDVVRKALRRLEDPDEAREIMAEVNSDDTFYV
jgi:hypothetical protein